MNKRILKTIKLILMAVITVSLIFALIVSQDEHHLETCNEENCALCSIIHIAKTIINISVAIITCTFIGFLIRLLLLIIHKEKGIFAHKSLVLQKVQLNE